MNTSTKQYLTITELAILHTQKEIRSLCTRISTAAIQLNRPDFHIDYLYSGHVNKVELRVWIGGFSSANKKARSILCIYLAPIIYTSTPETEALEYIKIKNALHAALKALRQLSKKQSQKSQVTA